MGNYFAWLPDSVTVLGITVPMEVALALGITIFLVGCCCCCSKRRKPDKPVAGESFRWPSSASFMKKTDPGNPPKLVVVKYEDPIRTDELPEDTETFWVVKYQPNGERNEVTNQMYLRFAGGRVHGVGYEEARKLCKISGKYRLNKQSNQTVLAIECNFSNECDTVLFHGWGNGTGMIGNCFVREINPFSVFSNVPGVRRMSRDKYKGSFLMLKQSGMGDPSLRSRVHTRRVHKWAGDCYPDHCE
ncbi:unnamed protein product [Scytosiphon promiscuus]